MALGQPVGQLAVGERADMLVLDSRDPFLATANDRERLNRWIFACSTNPIKDVMVGGRWVITDKHHEKDDDITLLFIKVMESIIH